MEEAKNSGVAEIIDHKVPTEEEIDQDMQLLAKEQERLLNDLKKAYQEEAERSREAESAEKQKEMEERLRAMNLNFTPENEEELANIKSVSFVFMWGVIFLCPFHSRNSNFVKQWLNGKDNGFRTC